MDKSKKARFDYCKDISVVVEVGREVFVDIYDADELIATNLECEFKVMYERGSVITLELKEYKQIFKLMDILHRTSESVELEIVGDLSNFDSTFREFSKVKILRLMPERGCKFWIEPWIHSFSATSIEIGDNFIAKGGCVYVDCTLAREPIMTLMWDGKDIFRLFKNRYNLMSILCKGLDSRGNKWETFLCKGVYDPRLLLIVFDFLG